MSNQERVKEIREIVANEVIISRGLWTVKSALLFDELCGIACKALEEVEQVHVVWSQIEKEYERDRIPHTTFRRLLQALTGGREDENA